MTAVASFVTEEEVPVASKTDDADTEESTTISAEAPAPFDNLSATVPMEGNNSPKQLLMILEYIES